MFKITNSVLNTITIKIILIMIHKLHIMTSQTYTKEQYLNNRQLWSVVTIHYRPTKLAAHTQTPKALKSSTNNYEKCLV